MIPTSKEPTPVSIVSPDPVLVEVVATPPLVSATVIKGEGITMTPNTTEADDRVTEGQRHISRLWEYTQAAIALSVVGVTLYVLARLALRREELSANSLLIVTQLVVMATFIVTSYYTRTNHTKEGGVGPKASEIYRGR